VYCILNPTLCVYLGLLLRAGISARPNLQHWNFCEFLNKFVLFQQPTHSVNIQSYRYRRCAATNWPWLSAQRN